MTDPTPEPVAVTPFVREERYIVIKRKHLSPEKEARLRSVLRNQGISTVEGVVVECDWPEYETVWAMIEARVTGRLTHSPAAVERDVIARAIRDCPGAVGFSYESWCEQAADAVIAAIRARPAVPDGVERMREAGNALADELRQWCGKELEDNIPALTAWDAALKGADQ